MAIVYTVYHSGYGHTKLQAEAVHRGAGLVSGIQANIRTKKHRQTLMSSMRPTRSSSAAQLTWETCPQI